MAKLPSVVEQDSGFQGGLDGHKIAPAFGIGQGAGIRPERTPCMAGAVAYDGCPFRKENLIPLGDQEIAHLPVVIPEGQSLGVLEFAEDDIRLQLVPRKTPEHE